MRPTCWDCNVGTIGNRTSTWKSWSTANSVTYRPWLVAAVSCSVVDDTLRRRLPPDSCVVSLFCGSYTVHTCGFNGGTLKSSDTRPTDRTPPPPPRSEERRVGKECR